MLQELFVLCRFGAVIFIARPKPTAIPSAMTMQSANIQQRFKHFVHFPAPIISIHLAYDHDEETRPSADKQFVANKDKC